MNDNRMINLPQAIANVAGECIAAGQQPSHVINAVAEGFGIVLASHYEPEQAAAMLRVQAGKIEADVIRKIAKNADDAEAAALMRKGHEFINAMQIAGMEESTIVSALLLVLVERVTRSQGVVGAAGWLNRMAAVAIQNADGLDHTSQAH